VTFQLNLRSTSIAFCPEMPHQRTTIAKILQCLGVSAVSSPVRDTVCAFKWSDATYSSLTDEEIKLLSEVSVYNARCNDISKQLVANCNARIFERALEVNPTTTLGPIVIKSNRNAAHDGRVAEGPLAVHDSAWTYSILVNNRDGNDVIDYRVPVFRGAIPFVYIKRRPVAQRFSNVNSSVALAMAADLFSPVEIGQLLAFTSRMNLDFGEIDVLRDFQSRQIWVVDVNNTPYGPPNGLLSDDHARALDHLCIAFEEAFLT
jgi:hypothetical protein